MGKASQEITRQHRLAQFFSRTHGESQPDSMITAQISTVPKELRTHIPASVF